jgi:hypothetical protein
LRAPIAVARSRAGTRRAGPDTTSSAMHRTLPADPVSCPAGSTVTRTSTPPNGVRPCSASSWPGRQAVTIATPGTIAGHAPMPYRRPAPTAGHASSTASTRAAPTTHDPSRHPSPSTAQTASAGATVVRRTATTTAGYPHGARSTSGT